MKYYFQYEVIFKYHTGKSGRMFLRADNPVHLKKRFKELYPSRTFTSYKQV